jgi:hypothetical protein
MASRCCFLPATALLFCGAIVAGWRVRAAASPLAPGLSTLPCCCCSKRPRWASSARSTRILFFFCWEFTLLPLYFLVSLWGLGAGRQSAAVRYFLVMLAGGVPLLFGSAGSGFRAGRRRGALVFDLPTLLATPLPESATVSGVPVAAASAWASRCRWCRCTPGCRRWPWARRLAVTAAAGRAETRRLWPDPLRHPAGADRRARPALAARRFRHRGHPLRRRRRAGTQQPAQRPGVREPGACRAGAARPGRRSRCSATAGRAAATAQLQPRRRRQPSWSLSFLQRRTGFHRHQRNSAALLRSMPGARPVSSCCSAWPASACRGPAASPASC